MITIVAALPVPTPNLQLRVPGFPVLERITGGVDPAQPMPLVLVLHGIGGSEEQLVPYTNLKVPARLVYVRGPVPNGTARTRATATSKPASPPRGSWPRSRPWPRSSSASPTRSPASAP